jgi:hypothetical protein
MRFNSQGISGQGFQYYKNVDLENMNVKEALTW